MLICKDVPSEHILNFDPETGIISIDNQYFAHTNDIVTEGPYFDTSEVLPKEEKIELFIYYAFQDKDDYPYRTLYHSFLYGGDKCYKYMVANDQFDILTLTFYKRINKF